MTSAQYPVLGRQTCLPFFLTGLGVSEPEHVVKRDTGLVSHQFLFTRSGKGMLHVEGSSYIQTEGSIFYLAPGVAHEYGPAAGEWTTCWLVFRGNQLPALMESLGFQPFLQGSGDCRPLLEPLFKRLQAAASDPVEGAEKSSLLLYEYLLEARKLLIPDSLQQIRAGGTLEKALHHMDCHYAEDLTLDQLAAEIQVSPQHFCRLFKARMGMRPLEYLARRRVAAAKELLTNPEQSIASIGCQVGYPDLTYFGMVFRKLEGISPGTYRKIKHTLAI